MPEYESLTVLDAQGFRSRLHDEAAKLRRVNDNQVTNGRESGLFLALSFLDEYVRLEERLKAT
jgi:hypothetical protein